MQRKLNYVTVENHLFETVFVFLAQLVCLASLLVLGIFASGQIYHVYSMFSINLPVLLNFGATY